jgi:tetratricopeptide (TPR) repeat protein
MIRLLTCVALFCSLSLAQHQHGSKATQLPVEMYTGLGDIHHPVTTTNPQAQKYFDQGLSLLYGFNHAEATKAFEQASQQDPNLAMAYWGVAIVSGQNYNAPEFPELLKLARENVKKAESLAAKASPAEQQYIAALAKRYSENESDPAKREANYSDAMRGVMESNVDDLDAATLYAESLMNQSPWKLWSKDGKPGPNTERVITILESVIRRNPKHTGANHYYIHAVEASNNPDRALASANRLRDLNLTAGHLVHMPAHIYFRTGDYVSAADTNVVAAKADHDYLERSGIKMGLYPMLYYSHNMHFQALSDAMAGRFENARKASEQLVNHVTPALKDMPMVEGFLPVRTYVLTRFHKWDDVMKIPEPDKGLHLNHAMWQWAQGMAHTAKGDLASADKDLAAVRQARTAVPPDAMVDKNSLATVLTVAENVLAARIATARKDYASAQKFFQTAAHTHDQFNYIEPPEWPFPVNESLGGMLLKAGRPQEAEKAFRDDLERFPRNGRSLFGLMESLKAQGKQEAARLVEMQFRDAWKNADTKLRIDDL